MAIIKRAKRDKNYCVLPNTFLQDSTISFECRGLIAYLLSHTEDWVCRSGDLEREGKIGRDARRTIMKEAEKAGYLTFHTERLKNGQFNTWYDAHEEPVSIEERTTSWETGKSKPATGFTFSPGTGKPRSAESYDGQAVPILSTEVRSTELRIGDIDIPQTPSLVENPKANFPLANGDAQSVHAQPLTLEVPNLTALAKGKVEFFSVEVDGNTKTVHANGGAAPHPPGSIAPVPPSAQAAVIAPTPNAQLRVLSPLAESTGITASIEAVDQPCAPVSVEKRKTSRKAKTAKTDSPEEIQRKADHKTLMDTLYTRTGQPILNGGAQAAAIKRILSGYTVEQAIEVLDYQLAGNWRGPVSWLSVQAQIADYFRRKEQQQTKLGGNYGQFSKSTGNFLSGASSRETTGSALKRLCNKRALGDFG